MKKFSKEVKDYLARGMREEIQNDSFDKRNLGVRWHLGMVHETYKIMLKWQKYYNSGKEQLADLEYDVLMSAYKWWKDYFDISPKYARKQQDLQNEQDKKEREEKEQEERLSAIDNFLAME